MLPATPKSMLRLAPLALLVLLASNMACSAADPLTNRWDCQAICQRYADCFNHSYDVDACKDRCESDASNSDSKQNKLDDCHDCIGDQTSCVEDIANCSNSCGAFVP